MVGGREQEQDWVATRELLPQGGIAGDEKIYFMSWVPTRIFKMTEEFPSKSPTPTLTEAPTAEEVLADQELVLQVYDAQQPAVGGGDGEGEEDGIVDVICEAQMDWLKERKFLDKVDLKQSQNDVCNHCAKKVGWFCFVLKGADDARCVWCKVQRPSGGCSLVSGQYKREKKRKVIDLDSDVEELKPGG